MAKAMDSNMGTTRSAPPLGSLAGAWALDATQSSLEFRVKHFWGLVTVRGHFTRFDGLATVDPSDAVSASIRIDATSLDTKQRQRDKHLRSADFFDVEKHPTVTFSTRQVTDLGGDRLRVEGDLTAAGHTQPLSFEARLTMAGDQVTVAADVPVDRTAFGMTWNRLGMTARTALLVVRARFSKRSS